MDGSSETTSRCWGDQRIWICAAVLLWASAVIAQTTATSPTTNPTTTNRAATNPAEARLDTVKLFDGTTVIGRVNGLENGALSVEAPGAAAKSVPLKDVLEVSLRAATQPVATTKPAAGGILGAVVQVIANQSNAKAAQPAPPKPAAKAKPKAPKRPAGAWEFVLVSGDSLFGKLDTWSGRKVVLKSASLVDPVELPVDLIREIWTATPSQINKARALGVKVDVQDVAYVAKENDVVSVAGIVNGIDGESLLFTFNDQQRRIALDRLVGIAIGGHDVESQSDTAQRFAFHQAMATASGEMLSGHLKSLDDNELTIQVPGMASPLRMKRDRVEKILIRNGRVVYLTDLQPASVEQTPYFDRILPWRTDESPAGTPIVIQSGPVERGISAPSRTLLTYDIGGGFTKFQARVGFQQPQGHLGRVAVRVLGDGKALFENPDVRGDQPAVEISADVTGVKQLTLEIDFGQGQDVGDWAVFADPRVLRDTIESSVLAEPQQ